MDLAWAYSTTFKPSPVYKVDSSGDMQWNKTIDNLGASTIIQTNDEGYEIAGQWTVGVTHQYLLPLLKWTLKETYSGLRIIQAYQTWALLQEGFKPAMAGPLTGQVEALSKPIPITTHNG